MYLIRHTNGNCQKAAYKNHELHICIVRAGVQDNFRDFDREQKYDEDQPWQEQNVISLEWQVIC